MDALVGGCAGGRMRAVRCKGDEDSHIYPSDERWLLVCAYGCQATNLTAVLAETKEQSFHNACLWENVTLMYTIKVPNEANERASYVFLMDFDLLLRNACLYCYVGY